MSTINGLEEFVTLWNSDALNVTPQSGNTTSQPIYHDAQLPYGLRPSSIGQPAIISVYGALIKHLTRGRVTKPSTGTEEYGRRADLFNVGHSTEARLLVLLSDYGFTVDAHVHNSISPLIGGTCDCILDGSLLVDIKTAAAANFKRYSNDLPCNYIAQLAVYQAGLEAEWGDIPSCILMYNKDNSELQVIRPKSSDLHKALERVGIIGSIVSDLLELSQAGGSYDELVCYVNDNCEWPRLRAEVFNGEETGRFLIPTDVQYNPWLRHLLYETNDGVNGRKKATTYITRELDVEETAAQLHKLIQSVVN